MSDEQLRQLVAEVTRGSRINARLTWAVVFLAVVVAVLSAVAGATAC